MENLAQGTLSPFSVGVCVKTEFCIYKGRNSYKATHQRDSSTNYKAVVSSPCDGTGHELVLQAWMDKFTGPGTELNATHKVVARGSDHNGYYWILAPIEYHHS